MNGQHMMWIDSTLPLSFDPVSSVSCFGGEFPGPHHLASPFGWLHLTSFRFIWFGVSWFCARGQAMSRGARRFSSDNHCVEPRFRSVSLRRRSCRMMQNDAEWTRVNQAIAKQPARPTCWSGSELYKPFWKLRWRQSPGRWALSSTLLALWLAWMRMSQCRAPERVGGDLHRRQEDQGSLL